MTRRPRRSGAEAGFDERQARVTGRVEGRGAQALAFVRRDHAGHRCRAVETAARPGKEAERAADVRGDPRAGRAFETASAGTEIAAAAPSDGRAEDADRGAQADARRRAVGTAR